jgi:hypothetical protein
LCSYYQDTDLSVSNHQRLFFRKNLHGPLKERVKAADGENVLQIVLT